MKLLELKLKEKENEQSEEYVKLLEQKDRDHFNTYKRLNEAEVFRCKAEAQGISINTLQKSLEKETLENRRCKDINMSLVSQIKQERE